MGRIYYYRSTVGNQIQARDYERPHLASAAFLVICLRFISDNFSALTLPPLAPPSFPIATAAGFLPAFGSGKVSRLFPDGLFYYAASRHESRFSDVRLTMLHI